MQGFLCYLGLAASFIASTQGQCNSFPCFNGAQCTDVGGNDYSCSCASSLLGKNCSDLLYLGCFKEDTKDLDFEFDAGPDIMNSGTNCMKKCLAAGYQFAGVQSFACRCSNSYGKHGSKPTCTGPCPGEPAQICGDADYNSVYRAGVDCDPSPCYNGGTCRENVTNPVTFNCICPSGFDGTRCEIDLPGQCASLTPCENGATCTDLVSSYNCTCAAGYEGRNCSTDIDECATLTPCKNGATCTDLVNSYNCTCAAGYEGRNCSVDIDECPTLTPCENGATCTDLVNSYNCTCAAGYEGRNCSVDSDECAVNPCYNEGKCHDVVNGYECTCLPGYKGKNCENTPAPKQFSGSARVSGRRWDPDLGKLSSKAYDELKNALERVLGEELHKEIRGFIVLVVLRFWPGSVGFDYQLFTEAYSNATSVVIRDTLQATSGNGSFTFLDVKVVAVTPAPQSNDDDNDDNAPSRVHFEVWKMVIIVAAALVVTLLGIVLILAVQNVRLSADRKQNKDNGNDLDFVLKNLEYSYHNSSCGLSVAPGKVDGMQTTTFA